MFQKEGSDQKDELEQLNRKVGTSYTQCAIGTQISDQYFPIMH